MTRHDTGELRNLAKVYSEQKTYTYIKEIVGERVNFYNGYVIKVMTDMIVFFDEVLKREIPILLETIEVIEPSRRKEENGKRND